MTSERVDQLDAPAEVFYRRLMSKVDDHGLYDARVSILRSFLYPLRVDRVREADIARWIAACEKAGVIALYQHDGKPYLQMLRTGWQARSEPKYPLPGAAANTCAQVQATAPVFGVVVVDGDVVPQTPKGAESVVSGFPPGFERFWEAYPRKVGKDAAAKTFARRRIGPELLATILTAVEAQKRWPQWTREGGQYIPHPSTWLSEGRWADEPADAPQDRYLGLTI